MICLISVSSPRPADDFVRIPLVEPRQLPPGVPFDECLKPLKEPA